MTQTWGERLTHLSTCPDGWYGPGSIGPTEKALASARVWLEEFARHSEFRGGIFPLFDGGVSVEWVVNEWHVEAVFFDDGTTVIDALSVSGLESTPVDHSAKTVAAWIQSLSWLLTSDING